jgi:hypothetical protein
LPLDHHEEVESLGLLAEPAVEYTGSFLVFNRTCLLASACPTRAIPAFGPAELVIVLNIFWNYVVLNVGYIQQKTMQRILWLHVVLHMFCLITASTTKFMADN